MWRCEPQPEARRVCECGGASRSRRRGESVDVGVGGGDGSRISSVLMPDDDRLTLCVSTQVGCGFECRFCLTGVMGLERNLTAAEILGQVLAANRLCDGGQRVTHIVFMGMGEPLANYAALVQTLRILTDAKLGLGYSRGSSRSSRSCSMRRSRRRSGGVRAKTSAPRAAS